MFKVITINPSSRVCYKLLPCTKLHRRFLQKSHYDVLELPTDCSSKQIREAFIRLSKKSHPDVNKNDPRSKEHFVRVSEAYNVLIKPCSRREYDNSLRQATHPRYTSTSARYTDDHYADPVYKAWQDPSFYANRDYSKDSFDKDRPYYGIKGIKRMSNSVLVLLLVGFTAIGVGLQVLAIVKSHTMSREEMLRRSQEYGDYHTMVRERASHFATRERQVEEFERRVNR